MFDVTDTNFDQKVLRARRPVVVSFTTARGAKARAVEPALRSMETSLQGRADVCRLDIDKHPDLARRYNVRAAPEIFVFKEGQPRWKFIGDLMMPRLETFLNQWLTKN